MSPADQYREAIADSGRGTILSALPAVPNASKRSLQTCDIICIAGFRYLRGSNSEGSSENTLRIAAVMARRLSVSMLTLRTPCLMPRGISSTGTPQVGLMSPP